MKKIIFALTILAVVGCSTAKQPPKEVGSFPTTVNDQITAPAPTPKPAPEAPTAPSVDSTVSKIGLDDVAAIGSNSSCSKIRWADRGTGPRGYFKGMALTYAKAYCNREKSYVKYLSQKPQANTDRDAVTWFSAEFKAAGIDGSAEGDLALKNTFTLLTGLGMRESSGKHCEGRDMSATNVKAETCEAGLFQTSYNARAASIELPLMFSKYKSGGQQCFLKYFADGVKCSESSWKNYGSGDGFTFQEMAKNCPEFAANFAAITLRNLRKHYGPLNRKAAQIKKECYDMYTQVEKTISENPSICESLKY